jgi:hypothetical protein
MSRGHCDVAGLWLLVALATFAAAGVYCRPEADDFCYGVEAQTRGLVGSLHYWYTGWNGRYSQIVASGLLLPAGPIVSAVLPGALIAGLVAALAWCLRPFAARPWLLAMSAVFTWLVSLPALWQSVYWLSGSLTYTAPLIALAITGGAVVRRWPGPAVAALAFVTGGFTEGVALSQVVLWAALLVARSGHRRALAWALAGAVFAALVVMLAPGNAVRSSASPERWPAWLALYEALLAGNVTLALMGLRAPVALLAFAALVMATLPRPKLPPSRRLIGLLLALLLALVGPGLVAFVPVYAKQWIAARYVALMVPVVLAGVGALALLAPCRVPAALAVIPLAVAVAAALAGLAPGVAILRVNAGAFDRGTPVAYAARLMELEAISDGGYAEACYERWRLTSARAHVPAADLAHRVIARKAQRPADHAQHARFQAPRPSP